MDNYEHHHNGIWLIWRKDKWNVKSISTSYQFIHCEISHLDGGKSHSLIVVYAHYQLSQ